MDSWLIRAAARTIFSAARNSPSALTMLVFVNVSFTHIIPNANQAAWLSGELLKESPPNAERAVQAAREAAKRTRVGKTRTRLVIMLVSSATG